MHYADQLEKNKKLASSRENLKRLGDNDTAAGNGASFFVPIGGLEAARSDISSLPSLTQSIDLDRKGTTAPLIRATASQVVFFELGFHTAAGQRLQNFMKDYLLQLSLEILLETVLKLTGMNKNTTETFLPVIKLIRDAQAVVFFENSSLVNRLKVLRDTLNSARNSLKVVCPDSFILRGTDILCDVVDVLHKGLASSDLSELKIPVEKLGLIPELSPICHTIVPLLELGSQFQRWNNEKITDQDLVRSLLEKVLPEQLSLQLKMGEKISDAVQSGRLHVERLPAWPGMVDKMSCLLWLKTAFKNNSLREVLTTADSRWFVETLKYDAEEAEHAHKYLMQYVQPLLHFPSQGPLWKQLTALTKMPGLSEIFSQVDICLNENLGALGTLLKDNTTLSQLGGVMTIPGVAGKGWEALTLVDTRKSLTAVKNITFEVLTKTFGLAADATKAIWFVLKKGHDFWESAYSAGQSFSDPVRLYRDVISFIREDVNNNPSDYHNATVETLLATLAVVIKSIGGNHVPINWKGNTAEWLKAYAEVDPQKLTAVDKVLMYTVLEPRVVLEVKHAIQQEDAVQARQLLEPLSDALKSYAGDSLILRKIASVLPYLPAIAEAWKEIRSMDLNERQVLGNEFQQQSALFTDILHNSRKNVSPETMKFRQSSLMALHEQLGVLQQKCGERHSQISALQVELNAMKVAVESQQTEIKNRLMNELYLVQSSLDHLKNEGQFEVLSRDSMTQILAVQTRLHKGVRKTLVQEGVSSAAIMQAQMKEMRGILNTLTVEFKLTEIGSIARFATEALERLAKSKKPNVVAIRTELATLVRNEASDRLVDVVHWSKDQLMQLCTKEVELSPEDKDLGLFLIERDLSTEQLATGAGAGAASAALLSVLLLMFSKEDASCHKAPGENSSPLTTCRQTSNGTNERRGRALTLMQLRACSSHSVLQNRDGNNLKMWLRLALTVLAGAVTGAGIAATVKPAIREKYAAKGMTIANDPARKARLGENLYRFKENGLDIGIYLTDDDFNEIKESPQGSRQKRSHGMMLTWRGMKERQRRKVQIQKQPVQAPPQLEQWTNAPDHYLPVNHRTSTDYRPEIVDLSKLSRFRYRETKGTAKQEPDHFYLPDSPERDIVISKFDFSLRESAEDILDKYLRYVYHKHGGGITYDNDVYKNDIMIKYKTSNNWAIVTPRQLVTGQADSILKEHEGSLLSVINTFAEKDYNFPGCYPAPLKNKLKAADFWSETTDKIKTKLANPEIVDAHRRKIRDKVKLAISLNHDGEISQVDIDEKLSRAKPVLYKGRIVAGMFIIPHPGNRGKVKLYSVNPQFKAIETEIDRNIMHELNRNPALKNEIVKGFNGEISDLLFEVTPGAPNNDPIFYAWESHMDGGIENTLLEHITNKIYKDLDSMTVSAGEQSFLKGLEVLKWGMRIASVPLGVKGGGAAVLIESLASIIQAQLTNNKSHSEEYIQEAFWGVASEIVGYSSVELLATLGNVGLKEIRKRVNKSIDKIKNNPTEAFAKRELQEFSDFIAEQKNIQVSVRNKKIHKDYETLLRSFDRNPDDSELITRGYDTVSDPSVLRSDVARILPQYQKYDIFKLMISFSDNKDKLSIEQLGAFRKYIEYRHAQYLDVKAEKIMEDIGKSYKNKILSLHNLSQGALFVGAQQFGISKDGRCFPLTILSLCSFAADKSDDFHRTIKFARKADISSKNKISRYVKNLDALHTEKQVGRFGRYVTEFKSGDAARKFSPEDVSNKLISADTASSDKYIQIITPGDPSKHGHAMSAGFNSNQGGKRYYFYDPNTFEIAFGDIKTFAEFIKKYLKDAEVIKASNAEIINGKPRYELRELDAKAMYANLKFSGHPEIIALKDMLNSLETNLKYP